MSLDVYLEGHAYKVCPNCHHRYSDTEDETLQFYNTNITHNLRKMAEEALLYEPVWCPNENGITKAAQLVTPLRDGIALLKSAPERFRKFNPPNGWGTYEAFVSWLEEYLTACEQYPDADVSVWR